MDEMDVQAVDFCNELRQRVELGLNFAPVIIAAPIARKRLSGSELHALRGVGDGFAVRPFGGVDSPAQFEQVRFRNSRTKRTNRAGAGGLLEGLLDGSTHAIEYAPIQNRAKLPEGRLLGYPVWLEDPYLNCGRAMIERCERLSPCSSWPGPSRAPVRCRCPRGSRSPRPKPSFKSLRKRTISWNPLAGAAQFSGERMAPSKRG